MALIRKNDDTNPDDLTENEIGFLKGAKLAPEVKDYLSRQHENIGTRTTAFRKIAAAAAAEADAIEATRHLGAVKGESFELEDVKGALASAGRQMKMVESTVRAKDAEIMRLTAKGSEVVHSDD